jgi:N-acetylglutamate synthase-like GNAT family acetyltransferase
LAQPEDLERIEFVVTAAYRHHLQRMGFPPAQLLRDDSAAIEAGQIWVLDDPIVAAIVLIEIDDTLLVENLAVHPDEQANGIGRRLMEHAELTAVERGLRRVSLDRNEINLELSDFFAHLGYTEMDRRNEFGHRRVVIEKLLAGPA